MQEQVFHQPLSSAEAEVIQQIVGQHQANALKTQQLAIDASRLLASSEERLAQQAGSGFVKRFSNAISGKTREHQLQNQMDALQMQKFAWHYLQQLQQQNLINAQSIAVIRNNMGTMNDYIIETRGFLEQAIDKINRRLVQVEISTSFSQWALNVEANKRRFKSLPGTLLVLHLTYDFMRSHPELELTPQVINHLVVTLEKLGVDCDEDVGLLEFIIELIEQIEVAGIDRYRSMIELGFDGHILDAQFIQANISGIAFNALYFLSEQYEKIIDLTDDDEICSSDSAREKIISRFFGNEFSGLRTTYKIRDLLAEVVGGSLLVIDIYKDVNGLDAVASEPFDEASAQTLSLVSSLPDISKHSFLDVCDNDDKKRNYLRLLALCVEQSDSLSGLGREFIVLLAEKAGCPEVCDEIPGIADIPDRHRQYLPVMQDVLDDDDKVYTWLLDAFFLLTCCQLPVESPQVLRVLGMLKPNQFKNHFASLRTLINESDVGELLNSAAKVAAFTQGWKNIFRYRKLQFEAFYADIQQELNMAGNTASEILTGLFDMSGKALDVAYYIDVDDGSFLSKLGSNTEGLTYAYGRRSALSSLNDLRKKAYDFIAEKSPVIHRANRLIAQWNFPAIEFENKISRNDYDLDNSIKNENWHDQYSRCERQLDEGLTAFSQVCYAVTEQLDLFAKGDFDTSVVALKAARAEQQKIQREQEKLAKQSVVLKCNGDECLFSIQWQSVEQPPCDPETIRHIKTDGDIWLIVDNEGAFYRSTDRLNWQSIQPSADGGHRYFDGLKVVNGVWIVLMGRQPFYYSYDALTWRQGQYPDLPGSRYDYSATEDIVHFNGLWLWRFTKSTEYSYTEEGVIFDSTKTSTYDASVLYCAQSLDADWERWEDTPWLDEGVKVEGIRALPGVSCLLAFCKYDSYHTMVKKTIDAHSSVCYHVPGKDWRSCTWGCEDDWWLSDVVVTRMGGHLMCFYSGHMLTSNKGYEWKQQRDDIRIKDCFHLEDVSIFPSSYDGQCIYLSQDGQAFQELMFDEGRWQHFAANNQGALSVYSPNDHETFLQIGHFVRQPRA